MKRPVIAAIGAFLCCAITAMAFDGKREGRSIRTRPPLNSTMNETHSESAQTEIDFPALVKVEEWRLVVGFPRYEVSDRGRVRSGFIVTGSCLGPRVKKRATPLVLVQIKNPRTGYLAVSIGGKKRNVHVLACEAFNGPRPERGYECAHDDGDSSNNTPSNLVWKTRSENHRDKWRHGTAIYGEKSPAHKLTDDAVREIRASDATDMALADAFGVCKRTLRQARYRETWKHVA